MSPNERRLRKLEQHVGVNVVQPYGRALLALVHPDENEATVIAALGPRESGDEVIVVRFVRPGAVPVLH